MRILGIDPGLATVGLGLIDAPTRDHLKVVEWLTITTEAGLPFSTRLLEIKNDLSAYLEETKPDLAVIEKIYFQKNTKTAIDVSQARGVILTTLASHAISILEPTPSQLKTSITGDGRADKIQMQQMVQQMLNLQEIPKPDDAADALALAVYGALVGAMPLVK